jgi:hypothetical protein
LNSLPVSLRNPWLVTGLLYLGLGIGAGFFPLVNDLHYEFSALTALTASLFSGMAVIYRKRTLFPDGTHHPIDGAELWRLTARNTLLALVPLAAALVRYAFSEGCGIWEGIEWYLLLAPPSAIIGTAIAALTELVVRRRWLRAIVYILLWGGSMLRGAYEGYSGPHIFLYAWQVGFFPGGSWDAELPITARLVIYRAFHLLAAGALALVVVEMGSLRRRRMESASQSEVMIDPILPKPALLAFAGMLATAAIPLLIHRSDLGLTRTDAWLREALGDSLHTRFATIYFNAPSTDSLALWRAANLTDFYIAEHAAALGVAEREVEPITLYLYASPSEEQRLVGTSSAAFTKPWARKLNMAFSNVGSTLRHELAHVMIAPFGNPLGISTSQGLIEGSAMAMENDYLWRTLHQYVREMGAYGMAPEAEQIMGTSGFTSRRTSVSYVVAGSFSKWLIDTYGMAKYLKAFPWSDFEGAYGMSLHELSGRYHAFIQTIPLPDENYRATMRYLFGGGSFFLQKCLRRMGTLNGEGYQALAEERYELALERFERSLDEGINYGARGGILRALAGMGRYRELLDSAAVYDRDTASYPLLPFLIERGDARWALGDVAGARRLYDSMLALDISRQFSLRAAERRYFIDRSDSLAAIMRLYFTRPMRVTQRIAMLDEALTSSADHGERRVLTLMRASLIVDQLPRTAIETIRPLLASTRFDEVLADTTGEGRARLRLEAFIDGAIADQLEPALMMAPSGALPTGSLADLMPGAAIGMPGRYHIDDASPRGSGMYMNERRTERDRFISYLSTHPVLQK